MPQPDRPAHTKHATRIAAKAEHIAEQIADLKRNTKILARIGGADIASLDDEVAFQVTRAAVVAWCATHTAAEIATRRAAVHAQLGPEGVAAKGGSMRGLPMSTVAQIAEAELLDVALGE